MKDKLNHRERIETILIDGRNLLDNRTLVGGFPYNDVLVGLSTEKARQTIEQLKNEFTASELIIGAGCAIPSETPEKLLQAIRSEL